MKATGRPRHAPTAAARRRVAESAAGGMPFVQIAQAEGISEPTLRLHYRLELTTGSRRQRQAIVQAMVRAAKKGNVSAAKYLAEHPPEEFDLPEPARLSATAPVAAPLPSLPVVPEAFDLGKKAAATRAAMTAEVGTEWQVLLGPTPPVQ